MDVRAAGKGERMLRRVIALLVAFALLAERAAGRSPPVRLFVLWILRRAETFAREFAFEVAGMPNPAGHGPAAGNAPADALALAARLRALAAWLCALLPDDRRPDRRPARRGLAVRNLACGCGVVAWRRRLDTS